MRLGVLVNVSLNKSYVAQSNDRKQYADIAYYGLYDKARSKTEFLFNELSENIYFIDVKIDGLLTISLRTSNLTCSSRNRVVPL